jgi:hypothetical protein
VAIVLLVATSFAQQAARTSGATVAPVPGRISGVIVHAMTGQPLGGIEVSISPTEQRELVTDTVTGTDGRFLFEGVARGKYSLTAHGQGYSLQAYQQHGVYSTAVAVGPGLTSENLTFQIVPDASISGAVMDEENEFVRNGEVLLFARDSASGRLELRSQDSLENQGHYHFGHLSPGTYLVAVSAQPWYAMDPVGSQNQTQLLPDRESAPNPNASPAAVDSGESSPLDVTYRTTFYADAVEPESASPIQLHPGERAVADITLRAVPALHLTVRNVSKDPAQPGSAIVQQRIGDRALITLQARSQPFGAGNLKISGVPPGHLVLILRTSAHALVREVDVAADTDIDASDSPSGTVHIRGTVQMPAGASVSPGVYLRFINRDTNEAFGATVSPTGTFEVQQSIFDTHEYEVGVFNVRDSVVQNVTAVGAKVAGRTLILPRSGTVQVTVTMSNRFARIDGTVLQNNQGVSQTMVVMVPERQEENRDLIRRDQSDSDGTFSLYQVLPGRYTVVAIANGWDLDWRNPEVLRPYLAHGQLVEVTAARTYKISVSAQDGTITSKATDTAQ